MSINHEMNIADALQAIRDVLDNEQPAGSEAHAGLEFLRLEIDRLREDARLARRAHAVDLAGEKSEAHSRIRRIQDARDEAEALITSERDAARAEAARLAARLAEVEAGAAGIVDAIDTGDRLARNPEFYADELRELRALLPGGGA